MDEVNFYQQHDFFYEIWHLFADWYLSWPVETPSEIKCEVQIVRLKGLFQIFSALVHCCLGETVETLQRCHFMSFLFYGFTHILPPEEDAAMQMGPVFSQSGFALQHVLFVFAHFSPLHWCSGSWWAESVRIECLGRRKMGAGGVV